MTEFLMYHAASGDWEVAAEHELEQYGPEWVAVWLEPEDDIEALLTDLKMEYGGKKC